MEEFVGYLVKNLVEDPESVSITSREEEEETTLEVRVAADDVARVIGRKGRTIQAVRTIAATVAARLRRRVRIEVID
jgi:uncharacterized protein